MSVYFRRCPVSPSNVRLCLWAGLPLSLSKVEIRKSNNISLIILATHLFISEPSYASIFSLCALVNHVAYLIQVGIESQHSVSAQALQLQLVLYGRILTNFHFCYRLSSMMLFLWAIKILCVALSLVMPSNFASLKDCIVPLVLHIILLRRDLVNSSTTANYSLRRNIGKHRTLQTIVFNRLVSQYVFENLFWSIFLVITCNLRYVFFIFWKSLL